MPTARPTAKPLRRTSARTKKHKSQAARIRSSAKWRKTRRRFLEHNPLCCLCAATDIAKAAESVHHIEQVQDAPEKAFDLANLAPVCNAHHAVVSHLERAGQIQEAKDMFASYQRAKEDHSLI